MNPYLASRFQHLGDIERKRIVTPNNMSMRLNRGEQPEPLPLELQRAMRELAPVHEFQQYPDYGPFYELLSQKTGYPKEQIVVGAGIEEFIRTLPMICCEPGGSMAVTWPTCAMYEIYAKAWDLRLIKIPTWPDTYTTLVPDVLGALRPTTKLLMLPNPGQPVETYFSPADVEYIVKSCAPLGILVAIDEAHYGFGAESSIELVRHHENLVVLRTFSKLFGAASLRVGFAVASPMMAKALHAVRPSGEISGPSLHAATVLLNNAPTVARRVRDICEGRDWLRDKINRTELGLKAFGQFGFSLLVECDNKGYKDSILTQLAGRGIYVKGNFEAPLDKHFLLACGTLPLMKNFYFSLVVACTATLNVPA